MSDRRLAERILHVALRPLYALCLFASQFTSQRGGLFTQNGYVIAAGALLVAGAIALLAAASVSCRRAAREDTIAATGPFRYIRHPIYAAIYLLSAGLGLVFFAWLWFAVLAAFAPLWCWECRLEERDMIARHGAAYADYRERTGMFLPRLT